MIWTPELIMMLVNLGIRVGGIFIDRRSQGEGATDGELISKAIQNLDETERILLGVIAGGTKPPTEADIAAAFAPVKKPSKKKTK